MSVFKEFYSAAHEIQCASRQIWPDSIDFGVPVKKGDKFWKLTQEIKCYFNLLAETDKREEIKYGTGTTVYMDITVFNEWNGSMDEEVWRMSYNSIRNNKHMDGIVSINRISSKKTKYSDD
jgi:hypothetical protein